MNMREAALTYAEKFGWYVFPAHYVAEDGGCSCGKPCDRPAKHPMTRHGGNDASLDADTIERWWKESPGANIGIATGKLSGLTVVDTDVSDGKPGELNYTKLCAAHGGIPQTRSAITGSGGKHYYFRYIDRLGTGQNVLGEAIDVRNDGGYVIAPPSLHKSGSRYQWLREIALLEAPDWLRPKERKRSAPGRVRRLTLDQVADALDYIDPDDRDRWLAVGVILGREFAARAEAWDLYQRWSARSPLYDHDRTGNDARMRDMFYKRSNEKARGDALTLGSLVAWAREGGWSPQPESVESFGKFLYVRPAGKYLYQPTGALWTAQAVDAALDALLLGYTDRGAPIYQKPSDLLARHRGVDSTIFDPALPQIEHGKAARPQGLIEDDGSVLFNTYYPPTLAPGDPNAATPFIDHVRKLFPTAANADHVIAWLAHRVQRPGEKVRHALVLGGPPGVGKDTIIEAVLPAIGQWNAASISPDQIFESFNEFAAAVLIRINEVVDLHEISRYKFYEATKTLIAGAPEYVEVNPKYGTKYHARNIAGVVMTTNHSTTGMYLPGDDRRHFVVETIDLWGTADERASYFRSLWRWLFNDGFAHVMAYLREVDLSSFDSNSPPPKTETFNKIVVNSLSSDGWLLDALHKLGMPAMVRGDTLRSAIRLDDLTPQHIARNLGAAMARQGYELFPSPSRRDGRHEFSDRKLAVVYVKRGTPNSQLAALLASLKPPPEGF